MTDATERQVRDLALLERIRHGDTEALAILARDYMVPLTRVAYAALGSNMYVDDVIQDVLFSIWENRAALDVRGNVAGYLTRAVRHRALNVLRHERVENRVTSAVAIPIHEQHVSNEAESRLNEAEFQAQLESLLANVPKSPREVFLLSLSGINYAEIANILGLTVPSVRTLMYRATQRLLKNRQG